MTDQATEPRQAFSARVPIPVWEEMERAKMRYGDPEKGDRTALVEDALRNHLNLPAAEQGPEAGNGPANPPVQAPARLLVDVVAQRTGLPRALAERKIVRGLVTLGGEQCWTPGIDISHAPGLAIMVDGSPV